MQKYRPQPDTTRRGAMVFLCLVALVLILLSVVFGVDVAMMQLARTELRSAADLSAKSAAETLARTQDIDAAREAGLRIASLNKVGGQPFALNAADIRFGKSTLQSDGTWLFTEGATPTTAVRVIASKGDAAASGPVNLLFSGLLGPGNFSLQQEAIASHFSQDVVLAVDRSHSMCFDMTGVEFSYPSGTPTTPDPYCHPPHASDSRWAATQSAIDIFLSVAAIRGSMQRTALLTWGSNVQQSDYPEVDWTEVATAVDVPLTGTHSDIQSAIASRSANPVLGGTNMSGGLDASINLLLTDGRPLAKKSIVLLTDGIWNHGADPILSAQTAKANDITIHVISLLDTIDANGMDQVAAVTGGKHLHASNATELTNAFRDIALTLPVVLTK